MRIACVALLAVEALACAPREGRPDVAYRAFARAVVDRDADHAWALLSSETQGWLDARAKAVSAASGGIVEPSGRDLLLGTAARGGRPLVNVLVLRESRDRAVVEVEEQGGPKRQVDMVREGGWRVRIPPPA